MLLRAQKAFGLLASLLVLIQRGFTTPTCQTTTTTRNVVDGTDKNGFIEGLLDAMTIPDMGE